MRSRIRTVLLVVTLVAALAGCAAGPAVESGDEPESTTWTTTGLPGYYMVSDEIQGYCPNGEEYLGGAQIGEIIPASAFDSLEGYACVFDAPASGSPDEIDEFAYRVDEGLGGLIAAYADTTFASEGDCPDRIPADAGYPQVRVEYDDVGYTLTVAGCGDTSALDAARDALRVTEVARDTVTFAEYEESGF